jgi:hypothetical protein
VRSQVSPSVETRTVTRWRKAEKLSKLTTSTGSSNWMVI